MKLNHPAATVFIPDGKPESEAFTRITHMGIGAHQDDLEFMAFHGIVECFYSDEKWFGGITCTNGAGSSRIGPYAKFTDEEMVRVRRDEQNKAAVVGQFSAMVQLGYPSKQIKDPKDKAPVEDLAQILSLAKPDVIYTHNPADKHEAHLGVVVKTIQAIRMLPKADRPKKVYGCEVWRNLDWLNDDEKVLQDVTGHDNLAGALNGIFDSQIAGGKRYDRATIGRRYANATFFEAHATDTTDQLSFAIDLTPLAHDDSLDVIEFTVGFIRRFETDVRARLGKVLGK
jgi:LmbE family N-acetylglucosaminyl deacetylase